MSGIIKVGCCGYPVSMRKYYEVFSLVELNNTFYQYPKILTVEKWRREAPVNFEFTVKAHQDITHRFRLKVEPSTIEAFSRMKEICRVLKSKILLFQTPPSFQPEKLDDAVHFFQKIAWQDLKLVWETRGEIWDSSETRRKLADKLRTIHVSHVTDPFITMPAFVTEITYFRLHGLGERMYYYQYMDSDLEKLYKIVLSFQKSSEEVYVLFNNLAMFDDAMRFQHFLNHKVFPRITNATGLDSVEEVISKARYPTTKAMLIKRVGWKLVEIQKGKQIQLEAVLRKLPSKKYLNVEEVMTDVEKCFKDFESF
jgi:uncharacterized protein YecE (DUF72 family)